MADLEFNKPILMYPKNHGREYILSKHFYDRLGITLMHKGREIKDIEELAKANLDHLQLYGFEHDEDFYVMIASDKQMLRFLAKNDIFNSMNVQMLNDISFEITNLMFSRVKRNLRPFPNGAELSRNLMKTKHNFDSEASRAIIRYKIGHRLYDSLEHAESLANGHDIIKEVLRYDPIVDSYFVINETNMNKDYMHEVQRDSEILEKILVKSTTRKA